MAYGQNRPGKALWWMYSDADKTLRLAVKDGDPTGTTVNGATVTLAYLYTGGDDHSPSTGEKASATSALVADLSLLEENEFKAALSAQGNTSVYRNLTKLFRGLKALKTIVGIEKLNAITTNPLFQGGLNYMFSDCSALEELDLTPLHIEDGITSWSTPAASAVFMFSSCSNLASLKLPGKWHSTSIDNMANMFDKCQKLQRVDFSAIDLQFTNARRQLTNISAMFRDCRSLTYADLGQIPGENVKEVQQLFTNCQALQSVNFNNMSLPNVSNSSGMFMNCFELPSITAAAGNTWFTGNKLVSLSGMFENCRKLTSVANLNVANWKVDNVTNMSKLFRNCFVLTDGVDVSQWNTENVIHMDELFSSCNTLPSVNVSNFKTDKVVNMFGMFKGCRLVPVIDVSNWNTENVTNMSQMFENCNSITELSVGHFKTDKVTSLQNTFYGCSKVPVIDVSNWNTANVTTLSGTFHSCYALTGIDVSRWVTDKVTDMSNTFFDCRLVPTIDVTNWNTSNVESMRSTFAACAAVSPTIAVEGFDTRKVIDMQGMFQGTSSLESLDVSGFETGLVRNMRDMFNNTGAPVLEVGGFDTKNVTNMRGMFANTKVTELAVNGDKWNTAKVDTFSLMFGGATKLENLDLSKFNTANSTRMDDMFYNCQSLNNIDVSMFNTERVVDMRQMFMSCYRFTELNVDNFNTAKVENMNATFANLIRLKKLVLNSFDGSALKTANNFLRAAHNMEYLDMHAATNFTDKVILDSIANPEMPNLFTLKYMPQSPASRPYITGQNIINYDGTQFYTDRYYVSDDTVRRYIDDAGYIPNARYMVGQQHIQDTHMKWEINIPYGFTADKVVNTRKIGQKNNAYTWYMPYTAPLPEQFDVYEFDNASVNGIVATFKRSQDIELKAQKAYLVVPKQVNAQGYTTSVDVSSQILPYNPTPLNRDKVMTAESDGWVYLGSFQWRSTNQGAADGLYTLQTDNFWKHYNGSTAKPRPFRGFLRKLGSADAPARGLATQFVDGTNEVTSIEKIELRDEAHPANSRIFDLNGRYLGTRRDVLPTGTYIIGGQKVNVL